MDVLDALLVDPPFDDGLQPGGMSILELFAIAPPFSFVVTEPNAFSITDTLLIAPPFAVLA